MQRLKWSAGARAVFVYIGPTPTFTRLLLISFAHDDPVELAFQRATAQLLLRAMGVGLPVRLQHEASVVTGADTRVAPTRVDALETTQAIQDLDHSVALVALKTTVVRVYLGIRSGPPVTVSGTLRVRRPGGAALNVASLNSVVLDSALPDELVGKRHDVQRSLNFLVPTAQTAAGSLTLELVRLTDAATGGAVGFGVTSPLTVSFEATAPLRLRLLGVRYQWGTPAQAQIPSALDFALIASWLTRAFPVAQVVLSQAIVEATPQPPFLCSAINAQVAAIRALDVAGGIDQRTHYYGLVSDGGFFMRGCAAVPTTPDPSAVASGPTGPGTWGWDFDGSYGDWYTGHELGHTFGRRHPGACGESMDDLDYPFPAGQLSAADNAFVGFDVGDQVLNLPMAALPGTLWHDVMTYCDRQWLSSYTYEGIRARLIAEDALGPGAGASSSAAGRPDERFPVSAKVVPVSTVQRSLISVVATVNLSTNMGRIDYVNPLPGPGGELSPPDPHSPVSVAVTRADGEVLYEIPVEVKLLSDSEPERVGLVDVIVPAGPDASAIELSIYGATVDSFQASATPPSVRDPQLVAGDEVPLKLVWETDAAVGAGHTYTIQVSTDNGQTWQTLAVGLSSPEAAIDLDQFGDLPQVLIRVIATDGFRSQEISRVVARP